MKTITVLGKKYPVKRSTRNNKKFMIEINGKTIHFGAKGFRIAPGTKKGNDYCTRSLGIKKKMIAKGGKSAKKATDPLAPNNLSRKKWKCKGKKSMMR